MTKQESIQYIQGEIAKLSETILLSSSLHRKMTERYVKIISAIKSIEQNMDYSRNTKATVLLSTYASSAKLLSSTKEEARHLKKNIESVKKTIDDLKKAQKNLIDILKAEKETDGVVIQFKRRENE